MAQPIPELLRTGEDLDGSGVDELWRSRSPSSRVSGCRGGDFSYMDIGYTLMGEQRGPRELVDDAVAAEQAGFDFLVASDHYSPWLEVQGHSPYTWSVLGAVAVRTERIPFMTFVTCPFKRYHPAVVAQKTATLSLLSHGRFVLGVGAGELLNEHVVGGTWPAVDIRQEMLRESVEIIRKLLGGDVVNYRGTHLSVESAKLYDPPED